MSESAPPRRTLAHGDLCLIGRAILGADWRRELAGVLDLEVEMVDDWASGRTPVPYVVVKTLATLAQFRAEELARMSERLTKDLDAWLGQS